ncbi:proline and serine-rich protein 1 isoform X2 [Sardina pilchardus]|uniref:proline and serine-rich protein 1 isoform X2 n=1 Tax=Sardina pilchardus TaxID=27697 RepID=UPI002E162389
MDKKSFDIVLDEIRKCVLTDQRVKAIEQVHGYFSSEQVIDILKYFSWAEPQIKAVKALQHKMVAIPTTKVANILNCFTFTKDKLVVLELIALNICDAQNYRPVEDIFRTYLNEKKRARRILEQVCKVGCKAPVAMISSCGVIPGNPYPKGRPSQVTGSFPKAPLPQPQSQSQANNGTTVKKEKEENTNTEVKGIAGRILGPFKPSPSTYNPHRPVPYPIPPCRVHATIAPSYSRPGSTSVSTTATISPHTCSAPSTPVSSQPSTTPAPTTPITPVFPGMVPSQNPVAQSPSPAPSPSVIKGPPGTPMSPHLPSGLGGQHPGSGSFPGMPPSAGTAGSVIRSHTPTTPCGTPGPSGSFSPSPFPSRTSRAGTPSGGPPTPTSRGSAGDLSSALTGKSYLSPTDPQLGMPFTTTAAGAPSHSVIRSYTPTGGLSAHASDRSIPHGAHGVPHAPSPKPSPAQQAFFGSDPHLGVMPQARGHGGNSGGSSPVPSAFKGPSRAGTPSLSSLAMPNSAALARSLGLTGHPHPHSAGSPQGSMAGPAAVLSGLQGMTQQPGASPGPSPFPVLSSFPPSLSSASPFPSVASSMQSSMASVGPPSSVYAQAGSPFGLGLTTAPSIFSGLPPGHSPQAFSGFGPSGPSGVGSPVLSSLMGLQGAPSSVASVAPLQAAAAAAAAAAGVPSTSPVLPGFASAFSSNYNPALVGQPGLTSGLQAAGGGSFPGLLSFPGMTGFSSSPSPATLSGLHNQAMQSALLQAHSASPLDSYQPQPNGFANYAPGPGTPFPLQPGLHPQLGWQ